VGSCLVHHLGEMVSYVAVGTCGLLPLPVSTLDMFIKVSPLLQRGAAGGGGNGS
jgi:hypothetical protein